MEPAAEARVGDRLPDPEPFQDLIGAIAIVHVAVQDQHALHQSFRKQFLGRDRETVERAVSARALSFNSGIGAYQRLVLRWPGGRSAGPSRNSDLPFRLIHNSNTGSVKA
jgi:hypothetical protein